MVKTRPRPRRKSLDLQLSDLDFFAPTSLPAHSTVALLEELAISAPQNDDRTDNSLLFFEGDEESSDVATSVPSLQSLQLGDEDEWPRLESNPPTLAELARSTVRRLQAPSEDVAVAHRSKRPPMQRKKTQASAESGIVPSIAKTGISDRPRSVIRRPPSRLRCEHELARSLEGLQLRPRRAGGGGVECVSGFP